MRRSLLLAVLSLSLLLSTLVVAQDAEYTFTPLDVPGDINTQAYGINAAGQFVGWSMDATGVHGFLTSDGVTFTPIDVPGAINTYALGINDRGQIVGWFSESGRFHGFVATPGK